jgi:hypothetical protein
MMAQFDARNVKGSCVLSAGDLEYPIRLHEEKLGLRVHKSLD